MRTAFDWSRAGACAAAGSKRPSAATLDAAARHNLCTKVIRRTGIRTLLPAIQASKKAQFGRFGDLPPRGPVGTLRHVRRLAASLTRPGVMARSQTPIMGLRYGSRIDE